VGGTHTLPRGLCALVCRQRLCSVPILEVRSRSLRCIFERVCADRLDAALIGVVRFGVLLDVYAGRDCELEVDVFPDTTRLYRAM
jgi:hypothetical protein